MASTMVVSTRNVHRTSVVLVLTLAVSCLVRSVFCRFIQVNLSPDPTPASGGFRIEDFFETASVIKNFVIRCDIAWDYMDTPLHVYYCSTSYEEQRNPNNTLINLTKKVSIASRRPWYGTVLVLKFASRACMNYIPITLPDVHRARDFFTYFP